MSDTDAPAALLEAARRGDREAASRLLVEHEGLLLRLCRHLLPAGEDAEAAVQETFLRALRCLGAYSGEGSLRSWLVAIAVNHCRDRQRRRRLVRFLPLEPSSTEEAGVLDLEPAPAASPERAAMARQAAAAVLGEVRRLPLRQREVFALRFFAELELGEIAAALGIRPGSVKTHLHRAVYRVRRAAEEAWPS